MNDSEPRNSRTDAASSAPGVEDLVHALGATRGSLGGTLRGRRLGRGPRLGLLRRRDGRRARAAEGGWQVRQELGRKQVLASQVGPHEALLLRCEGLLLLLRAAMRERGLSAGVWW